MDTTLHRHVPKKTLKPCSAAVDPALYQYVLEHIGEPALLREVREKAEDMDLPNFMSSPDEYQFLGWFCETLGVKRAIEVGVFRGTTTLAIAQHLPAGGIVRALDVSADYAELGREAWKKAGVEDKIDFIVGPAAESMQALVNKGEAGTYDFVYIDANKNQYPEYYELALQLLRVGGVIAIDNTLMHGDVIDPTRYDIPLVAPVRALNEKIKTDPRVSAVMTILADGVYFVRKL